MRQTLTSEYLDHPSAEAEGIYRSAIKLLARSIVQSALIEAHRQIGVSKPLPFTMSISEPCGASLEEQPEALLAAS